jgi:hypothetical protein
VDPYEDDNESSVSIKDAEYLEWLSDCLYLKKDSVPVSCTTESVSSILKHFGECE